MAFGLPLGRRATKTAIKTITFTGVAGAGVVGTVAVFTITGAVLFHKLTARCKTDLAGASATVEMGVSGNTAALIAQTTGTNIDAAEWWHSASPAAGVMSAVIDKAVTGNVIITVATADVTAGVLEITALWSPLSIDGNVD